MLHFTSPFFLCGIPFFQLSLQNRQQPLTPLVHHGSSLYLFQWTVWVCLKIHLPNPLLIILFWKVPLSLVGYAPFFPFFPIPSPSPVPPQKPRWFPVAQRRTPCVSARSPSASSRARGRWTSMAPTTRSGRGRWAPAMGEAVEPWAWGPG